MEELKDAVVPDNPLEELIRKHSAEDVRNYLSWLPAKYLDPLWLYHVENVPLSQIAAQIGITEKGVYQRIARAKEQIKKRMKGHGDWSL